METASPEAGGSPRGLEDKTPESKKTEGERPPFKVCFKERRVRGRSNISPSHPLGFGK